MKSKRLFFPLLVLAFVLALAIPGVALAGTITIGSRSCTSCFQCYNNNTWQAQGTPEHYVVGSSPEQVCYCLQHKNATPSDDTYSTTDVFSSYLQRERR